MVNEHSGIKLTGKLDINSQEFHPRRISQDEQPSIAEGELIIWHDTDNEKIFLLYNDSVIGHVETELK